MVAFKIGSPARRWGQAMLSHVLKAARADREPVGTSGRAAGTSGGTLLLIVAAAILLVTLVNVGTQITDAERAGRPLAVWQPFLWEGSSAATLIALAGLVPRVLKRWPLRRVRWAVPAAIHLALAVPFSLAHVAGMVALREAGYALAGASYDFAGGHLGRELVYEGRKDLLTYFALVGIFRFFSRRSGAQALPSPAPSEPGARRIELRDGATTLFVDAADITWIEAAGNYVEIHGLARTHLVRGALAAWAERLGPQGFVRAHRSRLVNRARIRSLRATRSGDLQITFDDGQSTGGSRRFRSALEA